MYKDPMMELLRAMLEKDAMSERAFQTTDDAKSALEKFMQIEASGIVPGDAVERNDMGRVRYKIPSQNQAAVCVRRYEPTGSDTDDMVICVALGKDIFEYFTVNSKFYRKVGANLTNVTHFKKKGDS